MLLVMAEQVGTVEAKMLEAEKERELQVVVVAAVAAAVARETAVAREAVTADLGSEVAPGWRCRPTAGVRTRCSQSQTVPSASEESPCSHQKT